MTPLERLLSKVNIDDESGCWNWTAAVSATYGQFWLDGRQWLAHRASFVLHGREIPEGLHLDHLCRNRVCVNPDHLDPVTPRENQARAGMPIARLHSAKTHCKKGHAFDAANTYVTSRGFRQCRTCARANQARYKKEKAA